MAAGNTKASEDTPARFARGSLTLPPGNPTVRINRQDDITVNLNLRVRVNSLEITERVRPDQLGAIIGWALSRWLLSQCC